MDYISSILTGLIKTFEDQRVVTEEVLSLGNWDTESEGKLLVGRIKENYLLQAEIKKALEDRYPTD